MRSKDRGFSLLEGLFALSLVTLIMGGIVYTLNQAAQVKRNTKNLDQAIEDFHALLSIESDLNAALSLAQPTGGATTNRIVLRRVDPRLNYHERIDPLGDQLNPYEDTELVNVRYTLDSGYLKRTRIEHDGTERPARLLPADSFQATLRTGTPSVLSVRLVVDRGRVKVNRSLDVAVRALP